jgi:hypothetical protein
MADGHSKNNEPTEHPGVYYEPKDIRTGCLLAMMAVAACVVVAIGLGMWWFYWAEAGLQQAEKRSLYPLAPEPSDQLPPEPRLEELNRLAGVWESDVRKRLAAQEKTLNSYGPTDEKGFGHIPIEQAIKTLAGNLPVRSQPPAIKDRGLVDWGQSNSGRMFWGGSQ